MGGRDGEREKERGERERGGERGNQMFAVFCTLTDENHTYTWSLHDHSQQKYWHQGKLALQCKMGESNFSSYSKLSNYSSLVIGRVNLASVSGKHLPLGLLKWITHPSSLIILTCKAKEIVRISMEQRLYRCTGNT